MGRILLVFIFGLQFFTAVGSAQSADYQLYQVIVKDGVFTPTVFQVAAHEKFQLSVTNLGSEPEEFVSTDMSRKRLVPPGETVMLFLGPLSAGDYGFFGNFHRSSAQGKIIAR